MEQNTFKNVMTLAIVAVASLAMATASAQAVTIISTFDSNVEGWTNGGTEGAVISQVGSGGNPDGYLQISSVQASTHLVAPAAFLGDLSAYDGGTFSWDGIALDEGTGGNLPGSYSYGYVTVTGTAGSATVPAIPGASRPTVAGGWTGFSHDFTAADFGVTQVLWDAILADVTSISLGGNAWKGTEDLGYDNIALVNLNGGGGGNAVPEPATATLALLGLGGLMMRRRRNA